MERLWRAYMVLGGFGLAAGLLLRPKAPAPWPTRPLPPSPWRPSPLSIARHRPGRRAGWWVLLAGFGWFYAGDLAYSVYQAVVDATPAASVADVFYLAGYPFIAGELVALVYPARGRQWSRRDFGGLIDVGILTTGLCLLGWVLVIEPAFAAADAPLLTRLLAVGYPLADVPILAVVIRLLLGRTHRTRLQAPAPVAHDHGGGRRARRRRPRPGGRLARRPCSLTGRRARRRRALPGVLVPARRAGAAPTP